MPIGAGPRLGCENIESIAANTAVRIDRYLKESGNIFGIGVLAMARGEHMAGNRSGFLGSLVYGVCGVIGVGILCATGVAMYGMDIVDRKFDRVVETGTEVLRSIPEIRESLPPVLADALDDRRAPEYREHIEVSAKIDPTDRRHGTSGIVIEAKNNGDEVVTMLAVRVNIEDERGRLVRSESAYLATPFALEGEWAGPILSDSTRQYAMRVRSQKQPLSATVEICDVRVWRTGSEKAIAAR